MQYSLSYRLGGFVKSLDADAAAFIAATGATDAAAINNFTKAVKDNLDWSKLICWPLRSAQNHGTGTVIQSLGGLGSLPGTLVNGPMWGSDGIQFVGAQAHHGIINDPTNIINTSAAYSIGLVTNPDINVSRTLATRVIRRENAFEIRHTNTFLGLRSSTSSGSFQSVAYAAGLEFATAIHSTVLGGNLITLNPTPASNVLSSTPENSNNPIHIAWNGASAYYSSTLSFIFFYEGEILDNTLYDIYKSTLGQGLGLP